MWEVFKILLLCLISVFFAIFTASWLYIFVIFLVFILLFYDFDFTSGIERHAIIKLKYSYLKVRNFYTAIFQRDQNISSLQYTSIMNSVNKQTTSFELSRFNKSGNVLSPISNSSTNGTITSRNLIQPRQTSTPLTKTSPWQKNSISPSNQTRSSVSILSRSPRYSLSSLSQKSTSNEFLVKPTIQTVTGPLLASTRFNVNLSTYTDSKSPGLASRVVQYHNELSGSQSSTHQAKYGSPGQFPIVQLYKKELPILNRPTRRCTVRIAPPDPVSYNSDHANTILRDSFVQNNVENTNCQNDTEINTRSVLEALKEISRKRIHTNDDMDDISKRQRKNSLCSPTNNSITLNKDGKRMREDTPPKPKEAYTTSINNASKRICVVNEIESSHSSSRLPRLNQGQKRKSSLNIVNLPETNKQRRMSNGELVSKETQTSSSNSPQLELIAKNKDKQKTISTAAQTEKHLESKMIDIDMVLNSPRRIKKPGAIRTIEDIDAENSTLPLAKHYNTTPVESIFSEAPLEIIKHNKLEIMLSALGGFKPDIIPLPDFTLSDLKKRAEENPGETDIIGKAVTSILSPKNKTKHDKHVTFAIPNSEKSNDEEISNISQCNKSINVINSTATSAITSSISTSNVDHLKQNISFDVPPLAFGTSSFQTNTSNPVTFCTVSTAVSNVLTTCNESGNNFMFAVTSSNNKINFDNVTSTTNSTNIITCSSINNSDNSNKNVSFGATTSNFNFGSPSAVKSVAFGGLVPSSNPNNVSDEPKLKNDLNTTGSTAALIGFQPSTVSVAPSSNAAVMFGSVTSAAFNPSSLPNIVSTQPIMVNFGAKSSTFSANSSSIVNSVATSSAPLDSTNNPQKQSLFFTGIKTTPTTTSTNMINFEAKSETKTTPSSTFPFGAPIPVSQTPSKSGGFKFDLGKSVATPTVSSSKIDSAKNLFGASTSSGLNKSTNLTFGVPNTVTTTSSAFNNTNSTPAFGTQITTENTPSFGAPNKIVTTTMFGTPITTNAGVFGTSNTTLAPNLFGTTATTTSSGGFAVSNNTLSRGTFGTPNTATNTAAFGSSNTTNNAGIFGSTPASASFIPAKTSESASGFNNNTFGSSTQNPGFGPSTQNSNAFGFGTPTTTAQNNVFGTATTTSSFPFGANTSTKAFTFTTTAATTASVFGSSTSTTTSNLFGGNASSGFGNLSGAANAFGTTTTTVQNTFGQSSANVFGTAPSSGFGSGTSGPLFNSSTNNSNNAFGSSATPNAFGASAQQQPNTFVPSTSNQQGNVFGVNNNNQGSGVFGGTNANNTFGSTGNTSFGTGFNNNNAQGSGIGNFGSNQTTNQASSVFAFGSAPQPSSSTPAASNAFQFGAGNQPKQSGFNFSANTNAPNINFGSGTPPAFSANPAPAYNNPILGQFNAAPATGMFNIGSGSTAPKQRPMIKARRRN